jgi:hypothetical protein
MRIRRLAVLSCLTAAIGGAVWWMKNRDSAEVDDEALLLDLAAKDRVSPEWNAEASEMAR